jgi:hypothetical protein|tara:strand:- start:402 stop:728 length:327 start_codon:yes stop_codon:yes gene_type:complete
MIKLRNLLTEVVSKSEVTKLMLIKNPKTIQAEYIRVDGKKEKNKYKVKDTYETVGYYFIVVGKVKSVAKEFNNWEFVIDKNKLTVLLRAKFGMATNLTSNKILKIKAK